MGTSGGAIDEDIRRPELSGEDRCQGPRSSVVNADKRSSTPVTWQDYESSETASPSNDKSTSFEAPCINAKLNPCPFCGSTNIQTDCFSVAFSVPTRPEDCFDYCKDCDAQGPAATDVAEAHERWNARGRAPAPGSRKHADDVL
jgi:Lar family restriction alleviation protein